jgi:hypothetical protein
MKIFIPFLLVGFCFCTGSVNKNPAPKQRSGIAVIELFTSEGCSSCPAADREVEKISHLYPGNVYALGFHVDYWNYIGWTDSFSSEAYSARQKSYADKLNTRQVYTPQVIINGEKQFVGSNKSDLISAIKEELNKNTNAEISLSANKENNDRIHVKYTTKGDKESLLNIALVQLEAATNVKRGENKNRLLHHINIVRELQTISAKRNMQGTVTFEIPYGLAAKDLEFIAFLQNKNNWQITGATAAPVQ